jgi:mannose-1-phosphate guanylyltransferase
LKAILLAAGFGTRLRPLTNKIPKCLVPIKGKPLLEIWLENLSKAGVNSILINTHYLAEQVATFIDKSKYKDNCILKFENQLLGTFGTLLNNIEFIEDNDCLFIHADNYCIEDLNNFIYAHELRPKYCLMTMMTFRTDTPSSCGIVEINKQNVVIDFHEKISSPPGNLANGAIYILSSKLIKILKKDYKYATDFSTEILPNLLGRIYVYETKNIFMDIGTPEKYDIANSI